MGCACKLALSLGRLEHIKELDISNNRLPILPDSLWLPPVALCLEDLNISRNALQALPTGIANLARLRSLDARHNKLHAAAVPWNDLARMHLLQNVRIFEGNHESCQEAAKTLRAQRPDIEIS